MPREIRVRHEDIADPQTITQEMEKRFQEAGLDLHRHDVTEIDDDFEKKERCVKVKTTRYFVMGE